MPCAHAGDQEDVNVLNEIVEDAAQFSGYDIIVDDGGHKSSQMLTSFRVSQPSAQAASCGPCTDLLWESSLSYPMQALSTAICRDPAA